MCTWLALPLRQKVTSNLACLPQLRQYHDTIQKIPANLLPITSKPSSHSVPPCQLPLAGYSSRSANLPLSLPRTRMSNARLLDYSPYSTTCALPSRLQLLLSRQATKAPVFPTRFDKKGPLIEKLRIFYFWLCYTAQLYSNAGGSLPLTEISQKQWPTNTTVGSPEKSSASPFSVCSAE